MCVVEFTGLHSNLLVCKLQFYTVTFTVFLYFLQNYSGNHSCQNYFVKTTEFFYSVFNGLKSVFHDRRSARLRSANTWDVFTVVKDCYHISPSKLVDWSLFDSDVPQHAGATQLDRERGSLQRNRDQQITHSHIHILWVHSIDIMVFILYKLYFLSP